MQTGAATRWLAIAAFALSLAGCSAWQTAPVVDDKELTTTYTVGADNVHVFSNGLTLIHRRTTANQIVAVVGLAGPGAVTDPDSKIGRKSLMMRLLTKGTHRRTSDQIAQELEGMGVRLSASDGYDLVSVSMQCVRGDLDEAFDVYADVVKSPAFPPDEIKTEKKRLLAEIRMREDNSSSAAFKRFRQALFSPHPYARPLEGEAETINVLTQIDLVEAHRETFAPQKLTFAIVGDVSFEEARALFAKHFDSLTPTSAVQAESTRTFTSHGSLTEFSRDVEQGYVVVGTLAPPLDSEDGPAVNVASALLGGGMSSRLFVELRDKRGLAYAVGATASQQRHTGFLATYIGTSAATLDQAREGLWEQVDLLRQEPVTQEELDRAKSYLAGGFLRQHETNAQQARYLAYWQAMGVGIEYDTRYPELVKEVTARDVMRVANKYFNDPAVVVLKPEPAEAASK